MTVPVITPLPPAPTRADAPSDFTAKADAFVAAQVSMVAEFNASAEFVDQRAIDADNSAMAAAESATASQGFADDANDHKQAALQAATDSATYRDASQLAAGQAAGSATAAAGSADAAAASVIAANAERVAAEAAKDDAIAAKEDAEYWAQQAQQTVEDGIIDDDSLLATRVRSALDASRGHFAAVPITADTAIGVLDFAQITNADESVTVTLPAEPEAGQLVMVGNLTDRRDHRIAVGTAPVKGTDPAGYLLINKPMTTVRLKYINAAYGWDIY